MAAFVINRAYEAIYAYAMLVSTHFAMLVSAYWGRYAIFLAHPPTPRACRRVYCVYAFSHSQLHNASALLGASLYLPCCLIVQGFFWSDGDA